MTTRDFALRWAQAAFDSGTRYTSIYCRPLLATCPAVTRTTTYAMISPHFHASAAAVELAAWTFVAYSAGPPIVLPHMRSTVAPSWENTSGSPIGPFPWLAVYGMVGATPELMWVVAMAPADALADGDTLAIPDYVRFTAEGM